MLCKHHMSACPLTSSGGTSANGGTPPSAQHAHCAGSGRACASVTTLRLSSGASDMMFAKKYATNANASATSAHAGSANGYASLW